MMQRMELKGVHLTIDDKLRKYVERKLGGLDRLLNRHSRQSAHLEVTLTETHAKSGKQCHCNLTLHLPHDTIVIKEATVNMYAAVDIAEAKLKMQLKRYKEAHNSGGKIARHLTARLRRRGTSEVLASDTSIS